MAAKKRVLRDALVVSVLLGAVATFEGCYYMQAINGQMEVINKRRPVPEVIADDSTDEKLRERLKMVQEARQFAVDELLLPDNDSYKGYTDLERDYVVWNVFAAPELSLEAKQWCYPVVGCVAYRGYFKKEKAETQGDRLRDDGYDVFVGGVTAYSTLGKFDDPVLNTMMRWSDYALVETLFHELAHQRLYIKNDTAFNESFASAVAEVGLRRWVDAGGSAAEFEKVKRSRELQRDLRGLVVSALEQLNTLYGSDVSDTEMRGSKQKILDRLSVTAQSTIDATGLETRNWLAAPLNNARMVSLGVYQLNVNAFKEILSDCNQDLSCFYKKCDKLAALDSELRRTRLKELDSLAADLP